MKRTWKNLITGALSCLMVLSLMISPATARNQSETDFKEPILTGMATGGSVATDQEVVLEQYAAELSTLMTDSVVNQLAVFSLEIRTPANISLIEEDTLGREVTRIDFEAYRIDIDESGTVVSMFNYEDLHDSDTSIIGGDDEDLSAYKIKKDEVMELADKIIAEFGLDGYEMIECTNDIPAVWIITWNNYLYENVRNPYDVMTVTIDARDGSVMLMERNTVKPDETEPVLTKEEAELKAKDIQSELGDPAVVSVELTVFRPNYYWESTDGAYEEADYVRLAWRVMLEDSSSIYVDARTGEILGGSRTQEVRARAVAPVEEFYRTEERISLAVSAFNRLGYTHHLNAVNYEISQADIDYIINQSQLKALFLNCHGINTDHLGILCDEHYLQTSHWYIRSDEINSNYRFVFLDACLSSVNDNFKGAFLGSDRTRRCFVGWNVSVWTDTAYVFNKEFWPLVGTMPVLDAVLAARAATLSAGYSDCNPGSSGDASYYGWALYF